VAAKATQVSSFCFTELETRNKKNGNA